MDDADLDQAVDGVMASKFRNAGHINLRGVSLNRMELINLLQSGAYPEQGKHLFHEVKN
ncbi:hypothetical protein J2S78_002836 [Salibacterium salarium]|nr:hypothetical protein [Salibacterium salarium]